MWQNEFLFVQLLFVHLSEMTHRLHLSTDFWCYLHENWQKKKGNNLKVAQIYIHNITGYRISPVLSSRDTSNTII